MCISYGFPLNFPFLAPELFDGNLHEEKNHIPGYNHMQLQLGNGAIMNHACTGKALSSCKRTPLYILSGPLSAQYHYFLDHSQPNTIVPTSKYI